MGDPVKITPKPTPKPTPTTTTRTVADEFTRKQIADKAKELAAGGGKIREDLDPVYNSTVRQGTVIGADGKRYEVAYIQGNRGQVNVYEMGKAKPYEIGKTKVGETACVLKGVYNRNFEPILDDKATDYNEFEEAVLRANLATDDLFGKGTQVISDSYLSAALGYKPEKHSIQPMPKRPTPPIEVLDEKLKENNWPSAF